MTNRYLIHVAGHSLSLLMRRDPFGRAALQSRPLPFGVKVESDGVAASFRAVALLSVRTYRGYCHRPRADLINGLLAPALNSRAQESDAWHGSSR